MTERLPDIVAREAGVNELGVVLNSVRSIAASRAQKAREALDAVDEYAADLAEAIGTVLRFIPEGDAAPTDAGATARVVFGAEEGFAGNFSERVLSALPPEGKGVTRLFLVGTRASTVATERGLTPLWTGAMSGHVAGIPKLADRIADALYGQIAGGGVSKIEVVYARFRSGQRFEVHTDLLLPLDVAALRQTDDRPGPLLALPAVVLLDQLTNDYVHAKLCRAALHAFAAENEARVEAMASARREIDRQLEQLRARIRQVRQEQITAEIVELAAGSLASA